MKTKLLFDADMLLFIACTSAEKVTHWGDDFYTYHCDMREATTLFDEHTASLTQLVLDHWNIDSEYEILMCLTSTEGNFRKTIDENYKANREGKRKPMCYVPMREWVKKNYNYIEIPYLEADDCIGINADKNSIIISGDKDFRSIPARFYDFMRNEYYNTTKKEAEYFHFYQTLVGDSADNYKGCPKIGDTRAKRILDEECSWKVVVDTFIKNGSTEEEALKNAQLAFILHKGYYNKKTKKVKLWTP